MTPADRSAAVAALQSSRAIYTRLDQIRSPEDAAADIIDLWSSAESAMQSMLGGSSLAGQTIVREVRQRGFISLDQANALAAFWDARARIQETQYHPTLTDVGYARVGYNALVSAVEQPVATPAPQAQQAPTQEQQAASMRPPSIEMPMYEPRPVNAPTRSFASPWLLVAGAVVLLVAGALVYLLAGGRSSFDGDMASAVELMQSGRIEAARAAFTQTAQKYPAKANPHVFLARLARNDGDMTTARRELMIAVQNEPLNPLPLREMGLFLLASNQADLATRFLVRAVKAAPADSAAQGYLGCALMQLNRVDEAQRFLTRAGTGAWSSCASVRAPAPRQP